MKKLIRNYIKKQIRKVRGNKRSFYFLRWLADIVKNEEDTKHVCSTIGSFLFEEHETYPFLDVFVVDDMVYIYTHRPGYWIGKGGETVNKLIYKLNHNVDGDQIYDFKLSFVEPKGTNFNSIITFKFIHEQDF